MKLISVYLLSKHLIVTSCLLLLCLEAHADIYENEEIGYNNVLAMLSDKLSVQPGGKRAYLLNGEQVYAQIFNSKYKVEDIGDMLLTNWKNLRSKFTDQKKLKKLPITHHAANWGLFTNVSLLPKHYFEPAGVEFLDSDYMVFSTELAKNYTKTWLYTFPPETKIAKTLVPTKAGVDVYPAPNADLLWSMIEGTEYGNSELHMYRNPQSLSVLVQHYLDKFVENGYEIMNQQIDSITFSNGKKTIQVFLQSGKSKADGVTSIIQVR